jgi:hypothetical protein
MPRPSAYGSTVTPPRFDRDRIRAFVALAADRLEGEWLLVRGAAAAAWFAPGRATEDIDLVCLDAAQAGRLALMQLAAEASLPIEAVNSTADYFVRRIDGWREHLVVLHRGARATIFRPDVTLFVLLKLGRLSEVDLDDCLGAIAHASAHDEPIDRTRVRAALDGMRPTDDDALRARRARLQRQVDDP